LLLHQHAQWAIAVVFLTAATVAVHDDHVDCLVVEADVVVLVTATLVAQAVAQPLLAVATVAVDQLQSVSLAIAVAVLAADVLQQPVAVVAAELHAEVFCEVSSDVGVDAVVQVTVQPVLVDQVAVVASHAQHLLAVQLQLLHVAATAAAAVAETQTVAATLVAVDAHGELVEAEADVASLASAVCSVVAVLAVPVQSEASAVQLQLVAQAVAVQTADAAPTMA